MAPLPKTDVVIIGLGAGGGIASYVLTKAGLNVVGIEAGPRLSATDFTRQLDEIGQSRNRLGAPKVNNEVPTWRTDANSATRPLPFKALMMNAVGGTSVHYGTQSWRYRADDFKIRSTTIAKYGNQAIPAGSTIADWPISYDDLEPYYDNVEYLIGVSGKGGSNPFESPRKRDYPLPPLRSFGYGDLAAKAMTQLGYHPFPQPAAIISQPYNGRPACTYCGFCGGFGCYNNSKSSTLVSAIAEAEKTGKLEIRPNSRVMKILSDAGGNVTGVQYLDANGQMQEQPARFVILSTYVYENSRLLLLSTSTAYPNGLSNNHGQVGKNYLSHMYIGVNALFPQRVNPFNGTTGQATAMDDLNGDNFDHSGLGFIRGSVVFVSNGTLPIGSSRNLAPGAPAWGSGYKRWLHANANKVGGLLFAQQETLAYEANFLDLDPNVKDPQGVPVIRVTYNIYDNEKKAGAFVQDKLVAIAKAMGATTTWPGIPPIPIPVNTHAYGGTRTGVDPASSVVNEYLISHEAPNLAVLGGSTFTGTTGYNPTETIEATSWRAAEHIAKNFNKLAV